MGYSSWSNDAYSHLSASKMGKSGDAIFTNNASRKASDKMHPKGIKFRESRDSDTHPDSLAVSVFLDVTGSMGKIPEVLVKEKLGALMNTLIAHQILHPQILFGAIGDHISDSYSLQIGQFESGTEELDKWLTEIYIEGGGGGQVMESYLLAWLIAGRHTSLDCFEKRGQKGFLFTIGDEASWDNVSKDWLKNYMGYTQPEDVTDRQLLDEALRSHHVFHIHVNEGSYRDNPMVLNYWKNILGERLIILDNYQAIAETIASTVAVIYGVDLKHILASMETDIAKNVQNALINIKKDTLADKKDGGVFKL